MPSRQRCTFFIGGESGGRLGGGPSAAAETARNNERHAASCALVVSSEKFLLSRLHSRWAKLRRVERFALLVQSEPLARDLEAFADEVAVDACAALALAERR